MRPRITLRCLTRLGINISSRPLRHSGLGRGQVTRDAAFHRDFTAVDPDLHPDPAVRCVGVDLPVADVGAERAQRDPAFAIPFAPGHLRAAEAPGDLDLHALGPGLHRPLDGLLHGLAEGDAATQLLGDVHPDQVGVQLRLTDLLDLQFALAVAEAADLLAEDLDVGATLADDDPGLGRVDGHGDVVDSALDLHLADARVCQPFLDELANGDVLLQEVGVVLVGVPLRRPGARNTQPEAVRVDLASHGQASRSCTTTVIWVIGL